jgi:hypothetical protein
MLRCNNNCTLLIFAKGKLSRQKLLMYMVNKPNQSAAIVDAIINYQYMVMVIITVSATNLSNYATGVSLLPLNKEGNSSRIYD